MSMTKRTQGRPPRNSGMNGREKLIEATRAYLQSNRKMSLTRTEIAQGCGVTPALISYYFKDKKSLLDAVMKPLLLAYRLRLNTILARDTSVSERMRRVIGLLIELNTHDSFLIDHVLWQPEGEDLDGSDRAAVTAFQQPIAALVGEMLAQGEWHSSDPALAHTALWGLCRAFGEASRLDASLDGDDAPPASVTEARIAFIETMFSPRGGAI